MVIDGVTAARIITADGSITIIGLEEGNWIITVLNSESDLYYTSEDVLTFNVTKPESDNSTDDTNACDNVKVKKLANPLKVKGKTVKVKFKKLKKKTLKLKVKKVVKFTKKGVGALTFKKVKGNKKIKVNKKTGKITIKKGLKKGTYKVKMKIKAKGDRNYKASSYKTVTFKIKVK